jgi:hypothetical protein
MKKLIIVCLSLVASGLLFAAPADNFVAGGWEFGGNAMYTLIPEYAPFSGKTTSADRESYMQILDVEANAGFFPADKLSLSLSPSVYWFQSHSANDDYSFSLSLYLDVGCAYYIPLGGSMVLAAGGKLGFGVLPGIDGMNSGTTETDKSLQLLFAFEPNANLYFFVSDHFAPFAQAGYRMTYGRKIKDQNGDKVVYPSNDEFFDNVYTQFRFTLGLKFFLPSGGGRFSDAPGRTFPDLYEKGGLKF